jgi:hypothetical protein
MGFESDLRRALTSGTAHVRTKLEAARREGDPSNVAEAEIRLLRAQVDTLTRIVVELAALHVDGGGGTPTQIGKHIVKLAGPLVDFDGTDDDDDEPELAQTAYRGAAPGRGAMVCARCRARLDDDEPELTLSMGRVCTTCFARGE